MIEPPLVSVIIPCYNAEDWLDECVVSVKSQKYKNIEIIIVDDSSTDNSVKIAKNHPGVRVTVNEQNMGECKTSAKGFALAKGKYICRLSADDAFVNPALISRQVYAMERYNLDFCYNSSRLQGLTIDLSKRITPVLLPIPPRWSRGWMGRFDNFLLNFPNLCYLITAWKNPINSSALMVRAQTYRTKLTWDGTGLRSCCDSALIADMFLNKLKGRSLPGLGSFYRTHLAQATGTPAATYDLKCIRKHIYHEGMAENRPFWMRLYSNLMYRRFNFD
jgi:glycosyltransferase involved in cell wall biosynthesis